MTAAQKAYRGVAMEGVIATWYTKNIGRDLRRFTEMAQTVARRAPAGARILEVAPGPGYLAIELAYRGYRVTALDISKSFVRIAQSAYTREEIEGMAAASRFGGCEIANAGVGFELRLIKAG
jgi:2-polyprenyl-3-methyl-5-hydroxy-6-metoxy-1,4-benzoquinol methylase